LRLGVLWTLCGRPRFGALELEKADRWICSGKSGEHPLPGGAGMTADRDNIRIEGRPDRESTEEG
ncbi:hypothetical protein JW921_09300, partial [Candidatus Fermentibacterales bacterium]|nr:hypothetical protein [Candidatus Fermentibacterales bacterium]